MNPGKKHAFFPTVWAFARNVGFLFIIFILGFIMFTVPDQSKDFVLAMVDRSELDYYISVIIVLFFWCYITWYSACIILEISPVSNEYMNDNIIDGFCRFMGFIPSVIIATCFFKSDAHNAWKYGAGCLVLGVIFVILFKIWDSANNNGPGKWPSRDDIIKHTTDDHGFERTPSLKEELQFVRRFPNVWFYFSVLFVLFIMILVIFSVPSSLIFWSRTLMPASVLMLALSFFTYALTVGFYFHDIKKRPFIFFFAWVIICSYLNDNTKIPEMGAFKERKDFRLSPAQAFSKWYDAKYKKWNDPAHPMPVIFIATQGGGIRGELWTSELMNMLKDSVPGFYDQVFCIGGASGGTVGALYYNAFVYDSLNNRLPGNKISYENFQKFTCADCISPVTASFSFGENLQRILPFPVACLDRSKIMMKAFSSSYYKHLGSSFADSSLLSMYYQNDVSDSFNVNIPSLFINGMLAETGQRVITSDLKLGGSKNFEYDIDFF